MTIQCLKASEINLTKWDRCINQSLAPSSYGLSWFLNTVTNEWHGLVLNDYDAVMPLTTRTKFSISYIHQPPFFQRTSIYSPILLTPAQVDAFYLAIPARFKLHEFSVDQCAAPSDLVGYEKLDRPNLILPLQSNYSDLYEAYASNTKRNIKKAKKSNIAIREGGEAEQLIETYRQNKGAKTSEKSNDFKRLSTLMSLTTLNQTGVILTAYYENKYAGGIFLLQSFNRWVLLFIGANEISRQSGAIFALIDHFIEIHASSDVILDFEGSSDPGVARFYEGFGSQPEKYFALKKDHLGKLISFAKRLR